MDEVDHRLPAEAPSEDVELKKEQIIPSRPVPVMGAGRFLNSPRLPGVIGEKAELPIDYRTIGNYNKFGLLRNRCSSKWRKGRVRDSVGEPEEDQSSCVYAGSALYRMMYDIILKGGRAFR